MITNHSSPWSKDKSYDFLLSTDNYEEILDYLCIEKGKFLQFWTEKYPQYINYLITTPLVKYDWIWCLYLPLIYDVKNHLTNKKDPMIIGFSGLPGSGKSTFAKNLQKLAKQMDISLNVISLDDFYLPSEKLDVVMRGNPWDVPRGYPGSHSINEINESIKTFLNSGILSAPTFDKSLRDGKGDRSGWIRDKCDVLLIEGWFLGCSPISPGIDASIDYEKTLHPPLTKKEIEYRVLIQKTLESYQPIWSYFKRVWQLQADSYTNTVSWKEEQEKKLKLTHGSSLEGDQLKSFVRMIKASIPQQSLQNIKSNVVFKLNKNRQIIKASINNK
tara:strand:+ start:13495 stop:14484 length:990 start_codon:yes stop_codon:yes gene_type:complete